MTRYQSISAALSLCIAPLAVAAEPRTVCKVLDQSIVGRSAAGIAQVSNLAEIQLQCNIAGRPFPIKPGETRNGLRATATAAQETPHGGERETAVQVNVSGGGSDQTSEWVRFSVIVPLDPAEREAEARRYLARLDQLAALEDPQRATSLGEGRQKALETLSKDYPENKTGLLQVTCSVTDGDHVLAKGTVEFEVLFKGHISDFKLPTSSTTSSDDRVSH